MKRFLHIGLLLLLPGFLFSQRKELDSLLNLLAKTADDSARMEVYSALTYYYDDVSLDSGLYYGQKSLFIARKLQLKLNEANELMGLSFPLMKLGNYPQALKVLMQAAEICRDPANEKNTWNLQPGVTPGSFRLRILGFINLAFGSLYLLTGSPEKRIASYSEGIRLGESINDIDLLANLYADMSQAYFNNGRLDSALYCSQKSIDYFSKLPNRVRKFEGDPYINMGNVYRQKGELKAAQDHYEKGVAAGELLGNPRIAGDGYIQLAGIYAGNGKLDSSLYFYKKAVAAYAGIGKELNNGFAYRKMADLFLEKKNKDSSFFYLQKAALLNDSLFNIEKKRFREFQVVGFNEQFRLQEEEKDRITNQNRIRTLAMLAGILIFALIIFLLYRNNLNRRKSNKKLEATLEHLRSTQAQLIQSEKMASLGELTAGIAHEIQNPLNFVNNFSDVNAELLAELKTAANDGNLAEVKEIVGDIINNEEKINHHGKRADAIVKGMLQHSRAGTGKKEPTDINQLADEYLKLAYHGYRAKDKSFTATLVTEFDPAIGKVTLVGQEISQVLLNLYNNAFYAVRAKALASAHAVNARSRMEEDGYSPMVRVATYRKDGKVCIAVQDNGPGIPDAIRQKIFQPFFTTKPTGQGTGLGLSLSYDIITRGSGGNLTVRSSEGEGTEFIIVLPV